MSKYFVTSEPSHQYPFTFEELRVRPPRKRSGLLLVTTACLSALFGGAAAFAFMSGSADQPTLQVASLDSATLVDTAIASRSAYRSTDNQSAEAKANSSSTSHDTPAGPGDAMTTGAVNLEPVIVTAALETAQGPAPLTTDDPRWSDEPLPSRQPVEKVSDGDSVEEALRNVAIAETEDDVVALEEKMNPELLAMISPENRDDPAAAVIADDRINPVRISAPSFATSDLSPARATKWVNMRAAAKKGAAKLMVIRQNAEILSDPACTHWCRVVYDGRLGYVYRTYVQFPGEGAATASAAQEKSEQTKTSEAGLLKKIFGGRRSDP